MKAVFVSDAHIKFNENAEDTERRLRFSSFLNSLKGNTELLILNGDIFDLWVPWKHVVIKEYFPLLSILADLHKTGTKIVMTSGNHDFWFSDFLTTQIGMTIHKDSFIEVINGKKFFVNHGDRFTKNDVRYHLFRSLVRNGLVKKIFTALHPDLALEVGIMLSRSSRKRRIPRRKQELMIRSLDQAARILLQNNDYDYVIFSHSHSPVILQTPEGIYANTGDWVSHSSYLEFIDNELYLKEFNN